MHIVFNLHSVCYNEINHEGYGHLIQTEREVINATCNSLTEMFKAYDGG